MITNRPEQRLLREVLLLLGMVLLALVQVTLVPQIFGFPPMLVIIVLVSRVLLGIESTLSDEGDLTVIRWAFYSGLTLDIIGATPLGSHALALVLATLLVLLVAMYLHMDGLFVPVLLVLLATTVYEVVMALVMMMTVAPFEWSNYLIMILVPSVLITLIPTLPIFLLLRWLTHRLFGAV